MTFKNQINKIKDNWLLILLILVLIVAVSMFSGGPQYGILESATFGKAMPEMAVARGGYPIPAPGGDFAPEVEERLRIKTSSLSTEVKTGTFKEAESKLKSIITASDAYLLNENVNRYGTELFSYHIGYYSIKVETSKYDAVVTQLKDIGKVESFSENVVDVTGTHTDLKVQLATEKERLKRYQEMYNEAEDVEDKIMLSDRIFNQERTIKWIEQRIENIEKDVSYSTISVTIKEKQSGYANIALVKFSALVKAFVNSVNSLLSFVFAILPWAVGVAILWFGYKKLAKKRV